MPTIGFEPGSFGIGSDRAINCQPKKLFMAQLPNTHCAYCPRLVHTTLQICSNLQQTVAFMKEI